MYYMDRPHPDLIRALPPQLLPYPEEEPGFVIPEKYKAGQASTQVGSSSPNGTLVEQNSTDPTKKQSEKAPEGVKQEVQAAAANNSPPGQVASEPGNTVVIADEEGGRPPVKAFSLLPEEEKKKLVPPGTILVEWYDDHDPAHPFNWSGGKHAVVAGLILSVYRDSLLAGIQMLM